MAANAADGAKFNLTVRLMSGQEMSIEVFPLLTLQELKLQVLGSFGELANCTLTLSTDVAVLEPDTATLKDLGVVSGTIVHVVAKKYVHIKRHVYRSGGGAPPYRSGCLVSSEDVELDDTLTIAAQKMKISLEGEPNANVFHTTHPALMEAPKLWADLVLGERVNLEDTRVPSDVFCQNAVIVCKYALRGMDRMCD